jgi:hypothetical protein
MTFSRTKDRKKRWIEVTYGRVVWRTAVLTAMNLSVLLPKAQSHLRLSSKQCSAYHSLRTAELDYIL